MQTNSSRVVWVYLNLSQRQKRWKEEIILVFWSYLLLYSFPHSLEVKMEQWPSVRNVTRDIENHVKRSVTYCDLLNNKLNEQVSSAFLKAFRKQLEVFTQMTWWIANINILQFPSFQNEHFSLLYIINTFSYRRETYYVRWVKTH